MKLPRDISGAEALKALERLGLARGNRRATVPVHRDLVAGTLHSILRQAGISLEESGNAL